MLAEHSSAILLARKGKIDLSIGIGSRIRHTDCTFRCANSRHGGDYSRSTIYTRVYSIRVSNIISCCNHNEFNSA